MKILVTGAAGFIASHVCEALLKKGFEVIGLDNFSDFYSREIKEHNLATLKGTAGFSFYELDITEFNSLKVIPHFDVLIHLAAKAGVRPSIKDPAAYIHTNILGTENLHQLMRMRNCNKMVFASSSSIYGNSKTIPFTEDSLGTEPISPYAYTKRACELLNYTNHHLYEVDVLNLRFFTVYGPRQRPDLAIYKFTGLIEKGEEIPVFGDGGTARDYTFIDDTVDGVLRALDYILKKKNVYEIINLGNNKPVKLKDLIRMIGSALDKEVRIKYLPMQEGDVDITFADIGKAKKLLGYNPQTSMEEGLKLFMEWFRKEKNYNPGLKS